MSAPLTLDALNFIKSRLIAAAAIERPRAPGSPFYFDRPPLARLQHAFGPSDLSAEQMVLDRRRGNAAVLIPLCNVRGAPGILLEVRGKLRTHSGEVRFV